MLVDSANAQDENERAKNQFVQNMFRLTYFIARKFWAQASFKDDLLQL